MKLSEELQEFLQNEGNKKLLNDCNFEELYQRLAKKVEGTDSKIAGEFSKLMFDIGVDPLEYMHKVPKYFLYKASIVKVVIPDHITSIGKRAFAKCKLKNIVIPSSVSTIEDDVFYKCLKLTNIVIPDGVTTISYSMFEGCDDLAEVTLPSSIIHIDDYAFDSCVSLGDINFKGTIEQWNAIKTGSNWDYETGSYKNSYTIHCTDGDLNSPSHS